MARQAGIVGVLLAAVCLGGPAPVRAEFGPAAPPMRRFCARPPRPDSPVATVSGAPVPLTRESGPAPGLYALTQPVWPYLERPAVPEAFRARRRLGSVTFARGSAVLNAEARGALASSAERARAHPRWQVVAVGFTDGVPEHAGSVRLSRARAEAAAAFLAARGVARSRIAVLGLGDRYALSDAGQFVILAPDRKVELWVFE